MLSEFKDVSTVKKIAEIEIPADEVKSELDRVTVEFSRQARIPGFRPGHVPRNVVRNRFAREIEEEAVQRLLPRFFHEALEGKDLETVGSPGVKELGKLEEGQALKFTAEFEVKPPVELGDYGDIEIEAPSVEVGDKDVDEMIERVRQQGASFRTVDRPAAKDDYVLVDVTSTAEGDETPRTTSGYTMHLGDDAPLPELVALLEGATAGEKRSLDKAYDEDAPNEEVRGKSVRYEVDVKEVRVLELPEVNDELAKSAGIAETIEEARSRIAEDLKGHREQSAAQAQRRQASDRLTEMHPMDVPLALVEEELQKSMRNYARFLSSQGVELERADLDWNKIAEEFRPDAEKRARLNLVLEAIAKKEEIVVSDTEVDAEIRKAAGPKEFPEVRHRLRGDGGYEGLRASMLQERALDRVVEKARKVPAAETKET
ncbi:MAG: trigger factor [Thermoanaerobaculia bacterium]